MTSRSRYSAPALEKGLDILELLASRFEPMSQAAIAQALGRTPSEIFRMIAVLERRGYLVRGQDDELYRLSPQLFELAHQHPPSRRLLDAATPEMHALAKRLGQSCHLVVRSGTEAFVIQQVDPPGFIGFSVRIGSRANLVDSCSGWTLLAFRPPWEEEGPWLDVEPALSAEDRKALFARLDDIRRTGRTRVTSRVRQGITDLASPVLDHDGCAVASLTVPYLARVGEQPDLDGAQRIIEETASRIARSLGGRPVPSLQQA